MGISAWAIFFSTDCKINYASKLQWSVQSNYRAELRAIVEAFRRATIPLWVKSDCKGIVETIQEIINGKHHDADGPEADLYSIIEALIRHMPDRYYKITWVPSHLLEQTNSKKRNKHINAVGDIKDLQGNEGADILANGCARCSEAPAMRVQMRGAKHSLTRITHNLLVHVLAEFRGYTLTEKEIHMNPDE